MGDEPKRSYVIGGRIVHRDELPRLRAEIESFDSIEAVDDDMRTLIEHEFPDLAHKLPSRKTAS